MPKVARQHSDPEAPHGDTMRLLTIFSLGLIEPARCLRQAGPTNGRIRF